MSALTSSLSLSLSLLAGAPTIINPMFYFSLATLVLGVVGALYLLLEWIHHRRERKFALYWSIGLFLLFWFQIPAILSFANQSFMLTDFNLFFSFAFPTAFIGSLLIYAGILSVTRNPSPRRKIAFILWVAIATILFFFYFANRNTIMNYSSTFIFILGFFLPLHILSLRELWRWRKIDNFSGVRIASFGIWILITSFIIRVFQNVFALDRLLKYPPEFWFVAIADSSTLFILQALATLLLLAGFFLVHQSCCKIVDNTHK